MSPLRSHETLRHYAHCALGNPHPVEQEASESEYAKPKGLWLSVDGGENYGWREWCEDNDYRSGWTHVYEIALAPEPRILRISDPSSLRYFASDFAVRARYGTRGIDWPRVAERYRGILIAPYVWECRLEEGMGWYYPWDCASACIWDPAAIESVRAVEASEVAA